ncbi:hypothetical protein CL656_06990 [bacterium]|nr:hypothetical protein [bacterium]|tara:strand:- start:5754 stop:6569 length:816 start_codon:yes stop_codon:yes gene_type:complete
MKKLILLILLFVLSFTFFQIYKERPEDFFNNTSKSTQKTEDSLKLKDTNTVSKKETLETNKAESSNINAEDHLRSLVPKNAKNIKIEKFPSDRNDVYSLYYESKDRIKDDISRLNQHLKIYELKNSKWNLLKEDEGQLSNELVVFMRKFKNIEFVSLINQEEILVTKDVESSNIDRFYVYGNYLGDKFMEYPFAKTYVYPERYLTEDEIDRDCYINSSRVESKVNYLIEIASIDCPPTEFVTEADRNSFERSFKVKHYFGKPGGLSSIILN